MTSPSPSLLSSQPLPPPPGEAARALHLPARVIARVAAFDRRVDKEIDRVRNPTLDRVMYAATELGDFGLVWHLVAAARGLRSDRHAADAVRVVAILGAESVLVNGFVKSLFRRTRPAWEQHRVFRIRRPRTSSFPSGHASSAFAAACVLCDDDGLAPLYYALAVVVASSRVYVKIHHASDVIAGVATGVVLGAVARKVWPAPVDGHPLSGIRNRSLA